MIKYSLNNYNSIFLL